MNRPTGGRRSADRLLTAGVAVVLGLLLFSLSCARHEVELQAPDQRAEVNQMLGRLEAINRQMDDLAARLEEDRRLLEIRQHAMNRARAHGTPDWVVEAAWSEAREAGLDPVVVIQLVEVESDWDADLVHVNTDGSRDYGLMQLNERTWPGVAEATHGTDPLDPVGNLRAGTYHLAWLVREYGGDLERATTAYNRGTEGLRRYVASRGTARSPYSDAVLRRGD